MTATLFSFSFFFFVFGFVPENFQVPGPANVPGESRQTGGDHGVVIDEDGWVLGGWGEDFQSKSCLGVFYAVRRGLSVVLSLCLLTDN